MSCMSFRRQEETAYVPQIAVTGTNQWWSQKLEDRVSDIKSSLRCIGFLSHIPCQRKWEEILIPKLIILLLLLLINNSLCEICRFSSSEGGDGVCFPNTGCFLTQIFSRDLFSYKDRWLWHKNQVTLFCREDSTWGLTECLKPFSDCRGPLERRGCLYGCYCMQHKLNPAGSVYTVCSFDCRVSSLLFISVFSVWIRWVPQIWHLLCVEPFISGGMGYHSELLHRKPRAGKWNFFFFPCGEKQITSASFHFSHFRLLTMSQGIKAISKPVIFK